MPVPVPGLNARYTPEMEAVGHVRVASLTGQRARVGDYIEVEDESLTRQRRMLEMLSQGYTKQEVYMWFQSELKLHHSTFNSDWRKLGAQLRSRLNDPSEVDGYVAAILARGELRQKTALKVLREEAPAPDPHTRMAHSKLQLQAAGESRDEDGFLLGILGTADQRWNKSTKLDVVGVDARDDEEREVMRRLLGPGAVIE